MSYIHVEGKEKPDIDPGYCPAMFHVLLLMLLLLLNINELLLLLLLLESSKQPISI